MSAKHKEPTAEQMLSLRARVQRIGLVKVLDEPFAFVWLCAKVFEDDEDLNPLSHGHCDRLLAFDVEAALGEGLS